MKLLLILVLLTGISLYPSRLRYKSFTDMQQALNFIADHYKLANQHLGGNSWWSTHRLVVVPKMIKTHSMKLDLIDFNIENTYVVYWKEL